jgi:limonene-1,2-epoxide hydrolase
MTAEEQRNLKVAARYEELYNTDVERFVRECYTPDCEAYAMGGGTIRGHEQFVRVEKAVLRAAPTRRMRVDHTHAAGNVVTVEAVLLNPDRGPDWQLPFCAVLTCRDGKIVTDRTYADFAQWPGLEELR